MASQPRRLLHQPQSSHRSATQDDPRTASSKWQQRSAVRLTSGTLASLPLPYSACKRLAQADFRTRLHGCMRFESNEGNAVSSIVADLGQDGHLQLCSSGQIAGETESSGSIFQPKDVYANEATCLNLRLPHDIPVGTGVRQVLFQHPAKDGGSAAQVLAPICVPYRPKLKWPGIPEAGNRQGQFESGTLIVCSSLLCPGSRCTPIQVRSLEPLRRHLFRCPTLQCIFHGAGHRAGA